MIEHQFNGKRMNMKLDVPPGIYNVLVINKNGRIIFTQKIIKQIFSVRCSRLKICKKPKNRTTK